MGILIILTRPSCLLLYPVRAIVGPHLDASARGYCNRRPTRTEGAGSGEEVHKSLGRYLWAGASDHKTRQAPCIEPGQYTAGINREIQAGYKGGLAGCAATRTSENLDEATQF